MSLLRPSFIIVTIIWIAKILHWSVTECPKLYCLSSDGKQKIYSHHPIPLKKHSHWVFAHLHFVVINIRAELVSSSRKLEDKVVFAAIEPELCYKMLTTWNIHHHVTVKASVTVWIFWYKLSLLEFYENKALW